MTYAERKREEKNINWMDKKYFSQFSKDSLFGKYGEIVRIISKHSFFAELQATLVIYRLNIEEFAVYKLFSSVFLIVFKTTKTYLLHLTTFRN